MRVFLVAVTLTCISFFDTPCSAQTVRRQSETTNTQSGPIDGATKGDTCTFQDRENQIEDYPNCILQDSQGKPFVAQKYVKKIKLNSNGLAAIWDEDNPRHEFMYVDRKGAFSYRAFRFPTIGLRSSLTDSFK